MTAAGSSSTANGRRRVPSSRSHSHGRCWRTRQWRGDARQGAPCGLPPACRARPLTLPARERCVRGVPFPERRLMHSILRAAAAASVLLLGAALRAQEAAKPDPAAELARLKARCDAADDKAAAAAQLRPEIEAFAQQHA